MQKYYEAYLLQVYGNPRSSGSVTGDSGVTSQHEERSYRRELISPGRRHSIQSASIPLSTPTTNLSSRVATPTLSKYSELRFLDPPRTRQEKFPYSNQQLLYTTPKTPYNSTKSLSSSKSQVPEICISSSFSPTLVSRDVQTDKPVTSFFDQSFTSGEPYQISGIGSSSQVSLSQTLPQFSNQFSHQVICSPQIHDTTQYLYTSLPKTSNLMEKTNLGSRTEFRGLSGLENTFESPSPIPSYPYYSWKYDQKSSRFENRSPIIEKNSVFDKNPIFERNSIFNKNSFIEDKNPPRFFRRFDFSTTFRRNDRPLPSSKDLLSSRTKSSLKPSKLFSSLKSDYDIYGKSRRMDNELDRYIGKIRNLHRDVELQSIEDLDHEQNTSGDLLNVTLSDDDLDLPADRIREKHAREERVEALAIKDQSNSSGKQVESRDSTLIIPNVAEPPVTLTNVPVSETRHDVLSNKDEETSAVIAADENNSKISKQEAEIVANPNTNSMFAKFLKNNVDGSLDEKETSQVVFDENKDSVFGDLISRNDDQPKVDEIHKLENKTKIDLNEKSPKLDDQKIEAENLETSVEDEKTDVQGQETEVKKEEESKDQEIKEKEELEERHKVENENKAEEEKGEGLENEQDVEKELIESQDYVQDPSQDYQYESNQNYNYDPNTGYDQYQGYSAEGYDQYDPHYGQNPSQYGQDANQYDQNPDQYSQDPNQEYDPSQYSQDINQYPQDPNQQYEHDPNQQFVQDPSQSYIHDPNQQYAQDPSQYDPNQQYQDPNVQYDPDQPYDPNQTYDYSQSQNYSEQDQSYLQQDQNYLRNQPYDQIYTAETAQEEDSQKMEVQAQDNKTDDVTKNIKKNVNNLESDTESTIERNASNTESDFDFN